MAAVYEDRYGTSAERDWWKEFGGPPRTRTLDPLIKSQLLCQLS